MCDLNSASVVRLRVPTDPFRTFLGPLLGILVGVFALTTPVIGQFILSPKSVVETGMGTFSATVTPLTALIDRSGLDHPFVSGTTDFDTYFAPLNSNFSQNADRTKWQSEVSFALPLQGTLDFDLGGTFLLSKVAIYNVSVKRLSILVSENSDGPWENVGTFSMFNYQSFVSMRAEVLTLSSDVLARYVRFSIEEEYTAALGFSFGYVIMGEVAFRAKSADVPAPTVSIAGSGDGDVVVSFTGFLQWKTSIDAAFEDVPGNPRGKYTVPKSSLTPASRRFFRSRQ